jgi:hypothetical protein
MKRVALDQIQQTGAIELPAGVLPHEHVAVFGVSGDCMNADGIDDGDLVVVDPERVPAHGDIGVFMIRNRDGGLGLTLKRLDLSAGTRLVPSNPAYPPVVLGDGDELFAVGTVVAVVHRVPACVEGTPVPGRPGDVTGCCGHPVPEEEWDAGYRCCVGCQDRDQASGEAG